MVEHQLTEQAAREFIAVQHEHWFLRMAGILAELGYAPPAMPRYKLVDTVFRACGQYNSLSHECTYSIPYCVYDGREYSRTIAHEICHSVQDCIALNTASHGSEFQNLMALAIPGCNPKQEIYHSANIAAVMRIADELKTKRGGSAETQSFMSVRSSLAAMRAAQNRR